MKLKNLFILIACFAIIIVVIGVIIVFAEINEGVTYDVDSVISVGNNIEIISEDVDSVTIKKKNDGDFKVLMFTDTHLNHKDDENVMTVSYIIENVTREKPDLVIFGGDNVSSALSYKRTTEFARLMDNLGVYWVAVLGNHDGEGVLTYSRKQIIDIYSSSEYCLVKPGLENIDGHGNSTINILNSDNSLKEVIFLMDSGDYMSKEYKEKYGVEEDLYDGVKESQVQWYKDKHDAIMAEYGNFKSFTVMHIPPYQLWDIEEKQPEFIYGDKNEGVCPAGFDSGLFDAHKEKGSCQAIYFGHDHVNSFGFAKDGIVLSYIQSSGYGSYNMGSRGEPESKWLQGCTILNINNDGTYSTLNHLNHTK